MTEHNSFYAAADGYSALDTADSSRLLQGKKDLELIF